MIVQRRISVSPLTSAGKFLFQNPTTVLRGAAPFLFFQVGSDSQPTRTGEQQNWIQNRKLTTQTLTKNLELLTNAPRVNSGPKPLQVITSGDVQEKRPLTVILSWLMSKKKHLLKYAHFYLNQGFDVLTVRATPWQLLFPVTGTQVIARDLLTFLSGNLQYSSTVLHGFSVGGYMFGEGPWKRFRKQNRKHSTVVVALHQKSMEGVREKPWEHFVLSKVFVIVIRREPVILIEVLALMEQDKKKYQPIIDRIVGQIWDSVVDFEGIPTGLPQAVFPNNPVLRSSLEKYVRYHLLVFQDVATKHYLRASSCYHKTLVRAPALFLCSLDDPVGSKQGIQKVIDSWEAMNMTVFLKCWNSSPHVSHLHHHPEDYKQEMKAFLDHIDLLPYPEKFQQVFLSQRQ